MSYVRRLIATVGSANRYLVHPDDPPGEWRGLVLQVIPSQVFEGGDAVVVVARVRGKIMSALQVPIGPGASWGQPQWANLLPWLDRVEERISAGAYGRLLRSMGIRTP